jgi:signal transduction histidine kinase
MCSINHLLDYSKISNFSSSQKRKRVRADATRHKAGIDADTNEIGVTSSVDLAQLTEDLVETVVSAHRFHYHPLQSLSSSSVTTGLEQIASRHQPTQALGAEDVSIVLNIPYRRNWCVEMQSGSWTRIVTNLVGNALKYTEKGTISVSLEGGEQVGDSTADTQPLTLIVEDSGIGISDTFLNNDLYTPFKQERSHTAGTGLGLSIVKQIAKELGAQLNVTSEVG